MNLVRTLFLPWLGLRPAQAAPPSPPPPARSPIAHLDRHLLRDVGLECADSHTLKRLGIRRVADADPLPDLAFSARRSAL